MWGYLSGTIISNLPSALPLINPLPGPDITHYIYCKDQQAGVTRGMYALYSCSYAHHLWNWTRALFSIEIQNKIHCSSATTRLDTRCVNHVYSNTSLLIFMHDVITLTQEATRLPPLALAVPMASFEVRIVMYSCINIKRGVCNTISTIGRTHCLWKIQINFSSMWSTNFKTLLWNSCSAP